MKIYFGLLIFAFLLGCSGSKIPNSRTVAAVTSLTVPELFCTTVRTSPNLFQTQLATTINADCDIAQPYNFNYIESIAAGVLCCTKK